jgi:hypothetical protein
MARLRSPYLLVAGGLILVITAIAMAAIPNGAPGPGYQIVWLGDTFLGDRAEQTLQENGYGWAFAALPDFGSPDLTVLSNEAPLTSMSQLPDVDLLFSPGSPTPRYYVYTSRGQVTRWVHRCSPAAAQAFADLGVDVVTLGNNHALDQGPLGLEDTIQALKAAGIVSVGAGRNAAQAARPFITDTPYGRLAIFSFAEEGGTAPDATAESAGICALNTQNVDAARDTARAEGVRWMVAAVHWGNNYTDVLPVQEEWARRLADKGFALVVGTGPHIAQRIEIIGRTPVIYSLGNFTFLTEGRFSEETPGYGLVATAILSQSGFREIRVTCVRTDNMIVEYQPCICSDQEAGWLLHQVSGDMQIEGAVGVLKW